MDRVLVLGVPRSGTTWVGRALGACDGAAYVHEPDGVHDPFAYRTRLVMAPATALGPDDSAPADYQRLWAAAFGAAPGSARTRAVARRLYAKVPAPARADARDGGAMPWRLRLAVAAARPNAPEPGARVAVVKSVDAALACEWIVTNFTPRVALVRRDLRSVVSSWRALGLRGPREPGYEALRAYAARAFAVELPAFGEGERARVAAVVATWSAALERAARHFGDWVRIAHEDVCVDPVARIGTAAGALGLDFGARAEAFLREREQPGVGYATQRVAMEQIDAWKQRLSADDLAVIDQVVARFPPDLVAPSAR